MFGLQAALGERFRDGGEVKASLLLQNTQLLEQLDHEASVKSQLQLELHKAEGQLTFRSSSENTLLCPLAFLVC